MVKKLRKVLIIGVVLIMSLGILCACNDNKDNNPKPQKEFYTLRAAYEEGLLSVEDLEQIAYYMNNNISPEPPLDEQTEQKIKEAKAKEYRDDDTEAVADGIFVEEYFGNYHGCYVIWMKDIYSYEPAALGHIWEEIGGVSFYFQHPSAYQVWVKN